MSVTGQVDEAFYFDSITPWHHIYVQDSVDSAEGQRDCWPHPVQAIADGATYSLNASGVECFLFSDVTAAILSPSHCVSALAGVVAIPLGNYECYSVRRLFEGSYCFASLFAKYIVNSRATNKRGAVST